MLGHSRARAGAGGHRMLTMYQLVQKNFCMLAAGVAVFRVAQLTLRPACFPSHSTKAGKRIKMVLSILIQCLWLSEKQKFKLEFFT